MAVTVQSLFLLSPSLWLHIYCKTVFPFAIPVPLSLYPLGLSLFLFRSVFILGWALYRSFFPFQLSFSIWISLFFCSFWTLSLFLNLAHFNNVSDSISYLSISFPLFSLSLSLSLTFFSCFCVSRCLSGEVLWVSPYRWSPFFLTFPRLLTNDLPQSNQSVAEI